MNSALLASDWLWWGIGLIISLPLAIVVLAELSDHLRRIGREVFAKPVDLVRYGCIPLLFLVLLLRKVVGWDSGVLWVRVVDTAFWITVLNAALALFNIFFFAGGASDGEWHTRVPKLLLDLLRLVLVLVGAAVVVSQIWGVDLRGLLTALGVGSLVIGLALQDTLGNLFSGIALISNRQFKAGDWIRVGNEQGVVVAMNWRSVSIRTISGDLVVIPNGMLARDRVRNFGAAIGVHAVITDLRFGYETPPDKAMKLLTAVAKRTPDALPEHPVVCRLLDFSDPGLLYRVVFYVQEFNFIVRARSEFLANLWYEARRAGLVAPAEHNNRYVPHVPPPSIQDQRADMVRRLAELGLLRLGEEALRPLLEAAQQQVYRAGDAIIQQGRPLSHVYFVIDGTAEAQVETAGEVKAADTYGAGQPIFFRAVLRNVMSSATVRATSDLIVARITGEAFRRAIEADRTLAEEVERVGTLRESALSRVMGHAITVEAAGAAEKDRLETIRELFRV